eukprot:1123495-Pyramimonas_sp.AAC.1
MSWRAVTFRIRACTAGPTSKVIPTSLNLQRLKMKGRVCLARVTHRVGRSACNARINSNTRLSCSAGLQSHCETCRAHSARDNTDA